MRYLISVLAMSFLSLFPAIALSQGYELPKVQHLDTETRFLCETETTFGWKEDTDFISPETWVSRTKYIIEPAVQIMQLADDSYVQVTHKITQLGRDNSQFCFAKGDYFSHCSYKGDDGKLSARVLFQLVTSENDELFFAINWLDMQSFIAMRLGPTSQKKAFEGGRCLKF